MLIRPRRLRKNPLIRELVAETRLSKDMFVYPYFVVPGKGVKNAIDAMPGIFQFSVDMLVKDVAEVLKFGLIGVASEKDGTPKISLRNLSIVSEESKTL